MTPAPISFNCAPEKTAHGGKKYFWKLSPMVAQGTLYITVRVLLRRFKKKVGNKVFFTASRKPYRSWIITEILSIEKDIK